MDEDIRGSDYDRGYSVQQTTDGGYIVAGYADFYGGGNDDVYLIKTDSLGDTLWTRTFGGDGNDQGYSVQQTDDEGYIVTGYTRSYGAGSSDVYLIKTNSLGDTLWTRTFGGDGNDQGYSVQQTDDEGYIITGYTSSYGAGNDDVYLIKTDSLGDTLWTRTFGGSLYDYGTSVQQTIDRGYIVTGSYSPGGVDLYLIKTDSLGGTLWTRTYGKIGSAHGSSVQQTTDGGFIVAGMSEVRLNIYDVYLIKTDSLGDTLWTRTFGGDGNDKGYSVQQTDDEGYIVTGAGSGDVYLIKTNSLGDTLWTRTFGGDGNDQGLSVQQTDDEGYIITGYTSSYGAGLIDIYLLKIEFFPEIIITSPNGGEEWKADSTYDITWTSYQTSGGVKIEYSLNNGIDWTEIIGSTPDDGSYPWTVPDTISYNCLVRISDTNRTLSDISNAVFTIYSDPFIIVTSPNGGEEWEGGSEHYITWTSAGTSENMRIEYSINNGSDWLPIVDSIADGKTYLWTIPFTPSDNCVVRITSLDGSLSDISDAVFKIVSFITVTSPNGGEEWYNEDNHNIRWVSAGTSGRVKIEYSINNGLDWTGIIANTPDDGSYLWNPPDTTSDSCLVSISDTNGTLSDTSDAVFSIIPGSGITIDGLPDTYSLNVKAIATGNQLDFEYALPEKANDIRFTLYNVAGLKIKEENLKESPAGFYSGNINMNGISKGIYFIKMEINGGKFTQTRKFVLM